ncbi:MAG: hypothetical protein H6772_00730 [Pseudomonadales bacterium]|nr:hypothetical protein [Pseudomonadales bacterium]
MTRKSQENGRAAEERVVDIALRLGLSARLATTQEDYGNKTDAVVNGRPIQVSVQPKSKKQRVGLQRRGIENIAAGQHIEDSTILAILKNLFNIE